MSDERREPTFAELLDWLEGRLSAEEGAAVAEAADNGGDVTKRSVEWIRSFLASSAGQVGSEPPPDLRPRLQAIFESNRSGQETSVRVSATLTFDSRTSSELVGFRAESDDSSESYQLAYTTPAVDILVDVTMQGSSHYRIDGQVLTADESVPGIWLVTVKHPRGSWSDVSADDLGCFALRLVPEDTTSLVLDNGRMEIEVPLNSGETATPGDESAQ